MSDLPNRYVPMISANNIISMNIMEEMSTSNKNPAFMRPFIMSYFLSVLRLAMNLVRAKRTPKSVKSRESEMGMSVIEYKP